jgi:hypothetical protein
MRISQPVHTMAQDLSAMEASRGVEVLGVLTEPPAQVESLQHKINRCYLLRESESLSICG